MKITALLKSAVIQKNTAERISFKNGEYIDYSLLSITFNNQRHDIHITDTALI